MKQYWLMQSEPDEVSIDDLMVAPPVWMKKYPSVILHKMDKVAICCFHES